MYTTTRSIAGGTLMTCNDCGHAISMNTICKTPLQSATDMLKHMAAHNASCVFAPAQPEFAPAFEPARGLGVPTPMERIVPPI